jgi:glucose uptake protein
MIVPATYLGALLLTIVTIICWGSWANTMKMAGNRWPFELYYIDFTVGVVLFCAVAAFTFGMLGSDINLIDNVTIVRKKQWGFAILSGAVFNLANMLLTAAIAVAGMSVAFPIGIGLALIVGSGWSFAMHPQGNPFVLFGGAIVALAAIIVASAAYRMLNDAKVIPPIVDKSGRQRPAPKPSAAKGILLSLGSGILMGSFYPVLRMAREDVIEMGPYSLAVCFAAGVFATTPLYCLYFLNLPVLGVPVSVGRYFDALARHHLLGLAGGAIWCAGFMAHLAASFSPPELGAGPVVSYAPAQLAAVIGTLWGLYSWKEFAGAPPMSRGLIHGALGLYVIGLALISAAPLFAG